MRAHLSTSATPARHFLVLALALFIVLLSGCQNLRPEISPVHADAQESGGWGNSVVDMRNPMNLDDLVNTLSGYQVVYLGEQHDRLEQHLMQARIIDALSQRNSRLVIGMEQFQRPFQKILDAYIEGEIDAATLLKQTQWYQRWRFDYRLYRPILDLARQKGIPVMALNADAKITGRIREVGLEGLNEDERGQLAQSMVAPKGDYRASLKSVFDAHPAQDDRSFERFTAVQMAWDETMAEGIARVLERDPQAQVVVLVGSGHVQYDWGIPSRVERRLPNVSQTVVLQADAGAGQGVDPKAADWLIDVARRNLPDKGSIGMLMTDSEEGVRVMEVVADSGGDRAGLRKNDLVVRMDDKPIQTTSDVRIHLRDKAPGDAVRVGVRRDEDGGKAVHNLTITLQALNRQHGMRHGISKGVHKATAEESPHNKQDPENRTLKTGP